MSAASDSSVKVEPVTDSSELPALASIFDIATKASGDKFHEVLKRYVDDPYQETMERLQAALSAPVEDNPAEQHFLFKAVETVPKYSPRDNKKHGRDNPGGVLREMPTKEKIVGMAHWTVGYIDLPKVDPFEQQAAPASVVTEKSPDSAPLEEPIATIGEGATASKPELEPFDFYAVCRKPVRNIYISQIRGKKHVCKSTLRPST
jgi:hypothetical protein